MIMDAIPLKPVYAQHTGPWSSKNMLGAVKIYLKFHRKVRTTWGFFPISMTVFSLSLQYK